jgi:uncharacterized protein involved in response to NO
MKLSAHPLWLAGFRPFFALAFISGLSLPVLWVLLFAGVMPPPATSFSMTQWHAHEMFFGFGWAVLGGFLLTSTKNWVHVRGYHGSSLILLAAAWVFERAGMWYQGVWPPVLFGLSNNLFLVAIVALLLWTLLRHRKQDTFRDNYFFLLVLPLFPLAKQLMLDADYFQAGWGMAIGLFRMAFLLMLERTLTQFMKNVFQADILRNAALDMTIKTLALVLVFEGLLPAPLSGWLALALGLLLAGRFLFWKPHLAVRRLDIGIMYLGYLAIVTQLLLAAAGRFTHPAWVGSVSVHVFTFGAMGLIIPAMLLRITKGHTGRKPVFDRVDKLTLWMMILGFVFRIIAPQAYPAGYLSWIVLAAACWFACFGVLAWRYIPYLMQPRVDGKEH